ncbi:copper amine oxidase N-terminal domain-containing protein [Brevibacillus nitrificans]|uniref:Copper amine oxidase N-terminal domain-containing protein n=1 Tax=Brevibacillus nitrificans TaxID=651560 RepID=A0A3M8DPE8_9BACL|nr:copper amine oxidase N-terminal domain-containing protein [Brevibacillus nitrificans]RNB89305.1 copper amine oxidase N-terminal domain-containing protein [Brevibacillus nitrificans]
MLKKLASLVLAIALVPVAAFSASAASAPAAIKVEYNQKAIVFPDQNPLIRDSRTLVPIRPIAESLGFDVEWNEQTRTVTINKGTNDVRLVVSQKIAKKNGQTINLDVPAQIINQRTMVPVRFIAEALDYKVDWAQATQTVLIADLHATQPVSTTTDQTKSDGTKTATPEKTGNTTDLIDRATIKGKSFTMSTIGLYSVTGEVKPGSEVVVKVGDTNFEVEVNADGSFEFNKAQRDGVKTYTLTAEKDGKTDVYEGEFTSK